MPKRRRDFTLLCQGKRSDRLHTRGKWEVDVVAVLIQVGLLKDIGRIICDLVFRMEWDSENGTGFRYQGLPSACESVTSVYERGVQDYYNTTVRTCCEDGCWKDAYALYSSARIAGRFAFGKYCLEGIKQVAIKIHSLPSSSPFFDEDKWMVGIIYQPSAEHQPRKGCIYYEYLALTHLGVIRSFVRNDNKSESCDLSCPLVAWHPADSMVAKEQVWRVFFDKTITFHIDHASNGLDISVAGSRLFHFITHTTDWGHPLSQCRLFVQTSALGVRFDFL